MYLAAEGHVLLNFCSNCWIIIFFCRSFRCGPLCDHVMYRTTNHVTSLNISFNYIPPHGNLSVMGRVNNTLTRTLLQRTPRVVRLTAPAGRKGKGWRSPMLRNPVPIPSPPSSNRSDVEQWDDILQFKVRFLCVCGPSFYSSMWALFLFNQWLKLKQIPEK